MTTTRPKAFVRDPRGMLHGTAVGFSYELSEPFHGHRSVIVVADQNCTEVTGADLEANFAAQMAGGKKYPLLWSSSSMIQPHEVLGRLGYQIVIRPEWR